MDRIGRKMKRGLFKLLLATFLALAILVILLVIQHDRNTWTAWHGVSTALLGARAVTLVEYVGKENVVRKKATPEEILRLRKAISGWWYPFMGTGYLCYDADHSIEIVLADGSELKFLVSFECETMLPAEESLPPAVMPPHIRKPLASFFASVEMEPMHEAYKKLEP